MNWGHPEDIDPIDPLCRRVVATTPREIPGDLALYVHAGVRRCIESLKTRDQRRALAGFTRTIFSSGGVAESRVVGHKGRLPAHEAAMLNVAACELSDADDARLIAPAVWSALATSDALGTVSSEDFVTAIALSVDLGCRLRKSTADSSLLGHHDGIYAGFVAAACAAKLRKFSADCLRNALGITLSQAAGTTQAAIDNATVDALQVAFNVGDGLRSAMFASIGVTGVRRVASGSFGFFKLFSKSPDESALTENHDRLWASPQVAFTLRSHSNEIVSNPADEEPREQLTALTETPPMAPCTGVLGMFASVFTEASTTRGAYD